MLALVAYFARMVLVTAGYHRYFSHRAFKTSRAFQFVLAVLAQSAAQKGPLWWAGHHRQHHKPPTRPRTRTRRAHAASGGRTSAGSCARVTTTDLRLVPDLARYPELRWPQPLPLVPAVALAVAFA